MFNLENLTEILLKILKMSELGAPDLGSIQGISESSSLIGKKWVISIQ